MHAFLTALALNPPPLFPHMSSRSRAGRAGRRAADELCTPDARREFDARRRRSMVLAA